MTREELEDLALLILAAHGGTMDEEHWEREYDRVRRLSPDDLATWRHQAEALARQHAARLLHGKDFL